MNGNCETYGKRNVLGIISIPVDGLLISGSGGFTKYISWEMGDSASIAMGGIHRLTYVWKLQKRALRIATG